MAEGHLSNEEFHPKLAALYEEIRAKGRGSVFIVQKPYTHETTLPAPTPLPSIPSAHPTPLPVLVRATNGKSRPRRDEKVKISTVVQPKDLAAFFGRLADTSKAGMSALKRKKKKVRKNDKKQKKAPKTS